MITRNHRPPSKDQISECAHTLKVFFKKATFYHKNTWQQVVIVWYHPTCFSDTHICSNYWNKYYKWVIINRLWNTIQFQSPQSRIHPCQYAVCFIITEVVIQNLYYLFVIKTYSHLFLFCFCLYLDRRIVKMLSIILYIYFQNVWSFSWQIISC